MIEEKISGLFMTERAALSTPNVCTTSLYLHNTRQFSILNVCLILIEVLNFCTCSFFRKKLKLLKNPQFYHLCLIDVFPACRSPGNQPSIPLHTLTLQMFGSSSRLILATNLALELH